MSDRDTVSEQCEELQLRVRQLERQLQDRSRVNKSLPPIAAAVPAAVHVLKPTTVQSAANVQSKLSEQKQPMKQQPSVPTIPLQELPLSPHQSAPVIPANTWAEGCLKEVQRSLNVIDTFEREDQVFISLTIIPLICVGTQAITRQNCRTDSSKTRDTGKTC